MKIKTKVIMAFIAVAVSFQIYVFTQVPEVKIYSFEPAVPDTRIRGYSPADVQDVMVQLGEEGRALYLTAQNKVDWIIPALGIGLFGISLWALLEGLVIRGRPLPSRTALQFATFGALPGLLDYAENILVGRAMRAGPDAFDPHSIEIASVCTQVKFGLTAVWLATVVVLAVARWRQSQRKFTPASS